MKTITIKGRYGKSKQIQTISFDSSRLYQDEKIYTSEYRGFTEYYTFIKDEDRKITFENESEMLSFKAQAAGQTKTETVNVNNLIGVDKVKAQFIDANEWAMYKDPNNCTLFVETRYMFDLPRIGERFNSNNLQWKVEEFIRVDNGNVKIYARLVTGLL